MQTTGHMMQEQEFYMNFNNMNWNMVATNLNHFTESSLSSW
jgi:hypothetical protein